MKKQLLFLICIITSISVIAQKGNVKVRKPQNDSSNLTGQWILLYDKSPDGIILPIKKAEVDTLIFYADKRYLRKKAGIQENGIWKLDWSSTFSILRYQKIIISNLRDNPPTATKRIDASQELISIGKDTMIFNLLPPANMGDEYFRKRYYTKMK